MQSLAVLRQRAKNGLRLRFRSLDLSIRLARAHDPGKTAIAKVVENDVRLHQVHLNGAIGVTVDPSTLPLADQLELLDLYHACIAVIDERAHEVAIRNALFQAYWTVSDDRLRTELARRIVESYLRSGALEDAARSLPLAPLRVELAPLEATIDQRLDAAANAFETYGPLPDGRLFSGRYDFVRQSVELLPALFRGKTVLHIAPETDTRKFIADNAAAWSTSYATLDAFSPHASIKDDIRHLEVADQNYDTILCHHVLEHIVDDRQAIREFFRVLRPGGTLHVSVPQTGHLAQTIEWGIPDRNSYGHVRTYGDDFADRLVSAGFECGRHVYLAACYLKHGRIWRRPYYLCRRP
jgi:SAM-dependent methyltransferase